MINLGKTWENLEAYQPKILKMIGNSILKHRVAHAYLFEGSRGTGKKDVSILFAQSLFCTNRSSNEYIPCNGCLNCRRISSRNHPDVHIVEPDGQSIKKGQIQLLQEEFTKTAVESNQKVYIIEHADKMTANAANSLLKFLEEPPKQTVAILLTENYRRLLDTIISRCQVLSFQSLLPGVLVNKLLEEGVPEYLAILVAQLTNNLNDAVDLSKSDWFVQARKIVLQLYEVLNNHSGQALILIQDKWLQHFIDKEQIGLGLDLLLLLYKDLLQVQIGEERNVVYNDNIDHLKQLALQTSQRHICEQMSAILEAKGRLSTNMNTHLLMEQVVLKLQEGL